MAISSDYPGACRLEIDLGAVQENYRILRKQLGGLPCAAAVKADAYGIGAERAAKALRAVGCETFFVITLEEAVRLRAAVPDARIAVLCGLLPKSEALFLEHDLIPVINDLEQLARLKTLSETQQRALPAILHADTGMNRLGLSPVEQQTLIADQALMVGPDWLYLMSHLVNADERDDPLNQQQLRDFTALRTFLPAMPASLANSSATFLGPEYHFDLGRPGIALYGGRPHADRPNPMRHVAKLMGYVLQVREVAAGRTVGYGATHPMEKPGRVATVALGYADGYIRTLSGVGKVYLGDRALDVIGRVSMDAITIDVSALTEAELRPGDFVEVIGAHCTADDVADAAGTIANEILSSLGQRYARHYIDPA
jgi:alanine racemase